jgi:DNA-binding response OmpR family regulator
MNYEKHQRDQPMALTICIIEDDEGIQDVLKIILNRAGYDTEIFSDGKAIFGNDYVFPDLFLIDKQLAGADGFTICRYLKDKRQTKSIPVIMMSAYPNIRELSILAGANDYIEKPFKTETLLATVKKYIQEKLVTRMSA